MVESASCVFTLVCACQRGDLYHSRHEHNQPWYLQLLCVNYKTSVFSVRREAGWTAVSLADMCMIVYSQDRPRVETTRGKFSQRPFQSPSAVIAVFLFCSEHEWHDSFVAEIYEFKMWHLLRQLTAGKEDLNKTLRNMTISGEKNKKWNRFPNLPSGFARPAELLFISSKRISISLANLI